jgi:sec-independent protein translocase protein TatB
MFDVGWGELFLIAVVALIVVGPKDLPGLFRTLGQFTGRARAMARDFQRTLEAAADDAGVSEVQKTLRGVNDSLGSASDAARKFSERKLAGTGEAPAPKPVVRAPAATSPVASPAADPVAQAAADPAPGVVPQAPGPQAPGLEAQDPERKAAS